MIRGSFPIKCIHVGIISTIILVAVHNLVKLIYSIHFMPSNFILASKIGQSYLLRREECYGHLDIRKKLSGRQGNEK